MPAPPPADPRQRAFLVELAAEVARQLVAEIRAQAAEDANTEHLEREGRAG